jgi:hypothetical protein
MILLEFDAQEYSIDSVVLFGYGVSFFYLPKKRKMIFLLLPAKFAPLVFEKKST